MKRFLAILTLSLAMLIPAVAYAHDKDQHSSEKREQWFKEMRAKKHQFMTRELNLTSQQQEPFFAIYDNMEDELKAINDETRRLEESLSKREDATDADYDVVIEALYNQRYREWNAENNAKEKLSQILSKKQLVKVKKAEAKFTRALMKQHRQTTKNKKK